jgi:hypothetical protein
MKMSKMALIVDIGLESALILQEMKEKYGDDVILVTFDEAREQGLKAEDFVNPPSYKITAPPMMELPMILGAPPSGKYQRRKRREQERKNKKR